MIVRRSQSLEFCLLIAIIAIIALPNATEANLSSNLHRSADIARSWVQQMKNIELDLVSKKWNRADRKAKKLESKMVNSIIKGKETKYLLWKIASLRAVALAGKGDESFALWKWHMAHAFEPEHTDLDFTRFGLPGKFLLAHDPTIREVLVSEKQKKEYREDPSEVTPPEIVKQVQPFFPKGQWVTNRGCKVVLRVSVRSDGVPIHPELLRSDGNLVFVYAAISAIRDWRFKPALLNGEPIAFTYVLTVNFSV